MGNKSSTKYVPEDDLRQEKERNQDLSIRLESSMQTTSEFMIKLSANNDTMAQQQELITERNASIVTLNNQIIDDVEKIRSLESNNKELSDALDSAQTEIERRNAIVAELSNFRNAD